MIRGLALGSHWKTVKPMRSVWMTGLPRGQRSNRSAQALAWARRQGQRDRPDPERVGPRREIRLLVRILGLVDELLDGSPSEVRAASGAKRRARRTVLKMCSATRAQYTTTFESLRTR